MTYTVGLWLGAMSICARGADEPVALTESKPAQPWAKGSVALGGFLTAFDSTVAFSVNNAAGVTVNAEELLGLDSSLTVFRVDAMFRPGESRRNQLDLTYAGYHRSGDATLSQSVTIGGSTLPVGAKVNTVFNFDIIRGTYSYALLQDDRMRLSVGLGLYAVPIEVVLDAQTTGGRRRVEGADTTLPLPAFALRGEFLLLPKLYLNASIDAMYVEAGDFKGSLLEVNVALEYRPWKHLGIGLGYSSMAVDVEADSGSTGYPGADFFGKINIQYSGLLLYGKLVF